MAQATQAKNDVLLGQIAKAFVAQNLNMDTRSWELTHDQAWVSLAARLLNRGVQRRQARRPNRAQLKTTLAHQHINGERQR
jgi:hypothetical protein